jgi:hypothetical protein
MADTHPIRNLDYLAWSNDLAWMERQSGKRWDAAVKSENERFAKAIKPLKSRIREFKSDLDVVGKSEKTNIWKWSGWTIKRAEYSPIETWSRPLTNFSLDVWDADAIGDYFAAAVPVKGGYERFLLEIYRVNKNKTPPVLIKTIKEVGPNTAFLNKNSVIYLGSEADHRYNTINIYNINTEVTKKLFELSDSPKTHNLELRRVEDGSVSVIDSDFVTERLGIVSDNSINWVTDASKIIVLAHDTWIKDGKTSLGLPSPFTDYLEAISLKGGWAITLSHGIRTLWKLGSSHMATKAMVYIWGEIHYDVREPTHLTIRDMRYEPYIIETFGTKGADWKLTKTAPHPFVCAYYNTVAPTFIVTSQIFGGNPKGLLVTAYGAYGFPTKVGRLVQRWLPLLKKGWAIASIAVPGSGDHDLNWRIQGQATGRKIALDTLCAAIKDMQEEHGVSPTETALYARSAGGLLVSAVLNESPGLVGALYMESPYLDAMRTITNPNFPLTILETNEFGIGTNPTDIIALGAWSPMEHIPKEGYTDVFMVARTDMADLEVYPYEVLKYITRARGKDSKGQAKLLSITTNKGHFTSNEETRAEDMALLDNYIDSNKNFTKKYNIHGMTRKIRKKKN